MNIPEDIVRFVKEFQKSNACPDDFKKKSVESLLEFFGSVNNLGNHDHLRPCDVPTDDSSSGNHRHPLPRRVSARAVRNTKHRLLPYCVSARAVRNTKRR
jgi:hypothetical protein